MDSSPDDEVRTRFVPLTADPMALLVHLNEVPYLVVDLTAGCDCHPECTLLVERRHCLN